MSHPVIMPKTIGNLVIALIICLLVIGVIAQLGAWGGFYVSWLQVLLVVPLLLLLMILFLAFEKFSSYSIYQQTLLVFLMIVWLSHLVQVFVPETGFDAVWYHLPVIKMVVSAGQLVYLPDFYQTLNPLFSDLIFGLGYMTKLEFGTKLVAYIFGLALCLVSYQLARLKLNRTASLLLAFMISTFQVVSWQSASFYIDVAKAFWEISAIWLLLLSLSTKSHREKYFFLILSALFLGASLATKAFSILLLPFFVLVLMSKRQWLPLLIYLVTALLVAFPTYFFAYQSTGNPFYVLMSVNSNIYSIAGHSSMISYIRERTLSLLMSPIVLLLSADYISVAVVFLLPLLIFNWKIIWASWQWRILLGFAMLQWLIWWYLPPLSTRYALSGFITLSLTQIYLVSQIKNRKMTKIILSLVVVSIWLNILPRFYVNLRSMKYILGFQTKKQYIEQFYDGWADSVLKKWYQTNLD